MPINLVAKGAGNRGSIPASLADSSSNLDGTFANPAAFSGALSVNTLRPTADFTGLFTTVPNRSGVIAATLEGVTSQITSAIGLYDLSSFNIPSSIVDNFVWPAEPSASTTINIAANDSAALNSALTQSDVHIIVPAGTYDWSQDITGSDLWLDMDNGAILDADNYNFRNVNGSRTKITGGNISLNLAFNLGDLSFSGHSGDLHIENVNINTNTMFFASTGGGPDRVALLNNTITTRDGIIYADTVPTPGGFSNENMIWAGNDFIKQANGQAHTRTYDQHRFIFVDNRMQAYGNSYNRFIGGSLDVFFGYNQLEQNPASSDQPYGSVNHFGTLDSNGQLKIPDRVYFNNNDWYSQSGGTNIFAAFAGEVTIQGNRAYQPGSFQITNGGSGQEDPPTTTNYSDNVRVSGYVTPPTKLRADGNPVGADH